MTFGGFLVETFGLNDRLGFGLLFCLGIGKKCLDHSGLVLKLIRIGLLDEIDDLAFLGSIADAGTDVDERFMRWVIPEMD
jgi:hypothetical protein